MKEVLPPFSGGRINQLGQFEDILEQARQKGLVNNVPLDEASTFDAKSQKIRLQTVATRLYLLGYLPRKIAAKKIDRKLDDIKKAVLIFQTEAGLKPDQWVGNKTWHALDELVAYESDLSENEWFEEGEIAENKSKAVHRSIQLRLWSLGLYKKKPNRNSGKLEEKDLRKFRRILEILIINYPASFGFNYQSLKILFDQDWLSLHISKRSSSDGKQFRLNLGHEDQTSNQSLAETFIVNATKIELWLLGLDVAIDGGSSFSFSTDSNLYKKLVEYYQKFGQKSLTQARQLAIKISPQLFKSISSPQKVEVVEYSGEDASKLVANQLNTTEKIAEAWDYVSQRGMSLWDGLKRVWRWVKKLGKKVISFITGNVFKSFFRIASKGYKIVTQGISSVVSSISTYVKGGFFNAYSVVEISNDMDMDVFISTSASQENNGQTIRQIRKQSKAFSVSCRIIALIFKLVISVIEGVFGWAKLLYSLIKNYSKLKLLYQDFKLLSSL